MAGRCTPTLSPRCPIKPCCAVGCNSTTFRQKTRKSYSYPKPNQQLKPTQRLQKSLRKSSPPHQFGTSRRKSNPWNLPGSRFSSRKCFANSNHMRRRGRLALPPKNRSCRRALCRIFRCRIFLCRISALLKTHLDFARRPPGTQALQRLWFLRSWNRSSVVP